MAFFLQIILIADDELDSLLVHILLNFSEPSPHVIERCFVSDVVHDDDAVCSPVVAACDGFKPILACSIPLSYTIFTICSFMFFPLTFRYFILLIQKKIHNLPQ